eukprot:1161620-Pelagomonas_calceolata.AAC.6
MQERAERLRELQKEEQLARMARAKETRQIARSIQVSEGRYVVKGIDIEGIRRQVSEGRYVVKDIDFEGIRGRVPCTQQELVGISKMYTWAKMDSTIVMAACKIDYIARQLGPPVPSSFGFFNCFSAYLWLGLQFRPHEQMQQEF